MSGSSRSRGRRRGVRMGAAGIIALALLSVSGSVWAADQPWEQLPRFGTVTPDGHALPREELRLDGFEPPAPARRAATAAASGFFRTHFVPRVSRQLEEVIPVASTRAEGEPVDSLLFATVSEAARFRAEKGTRRALKSYLLEVTTLDRTIEAFKTGRASDTDAGRSEGVRIGVGVSHALPQVEMRHRGAAGTMRLRVNLRGSVGLEFNRVHVRHTRIFVGYDADDDHYGLGCRFSF